LTKSLKREIERIAKIGGVEVMVTLMERYRSFTIPLKVDADSDKDSLEDKDGFFHLVEDIFMILAVPFLQKKPNKLKTLDEKIHYGRFILTSNTSEFSPTHKMESKRDKNHARRMARKYRKYQKAMKKMQEELRQRARKDQALEEDEWEGEDDLVVAESTDWKFLNSEKYSRSYKAKLKKTKKTIQKLRSRV
jgi:hypothetical protein